jgi:hypothetical protein
MDAMRYISEMDDDELRKARVDAWIRELYSIFPSRKLLYRILANQYDAELTRRAAMCASTSDYDATLAASADLLRAARKAGG